MADRHGDDTVVERCADPVDQLVGRLLPALVEKLGRAFPFIDGDIRTEAVEDALIGYILHPEAFDAARGVPLDRFLYVASWRNVADRLKAERRRRQREARYAQMTAQTTVLTEAPFSSDPDAVHHEDARRDAARARALAMVDTPREAQALQCWLDGETRWEALARVLDVQHLPEAEQRRAVKRFKDRFNRRLIRAGSGDDRKSLPGRRSRS